MKKNVIYSKWDAHRLVISSQLNVSENDNFLEPKLDSGKIRRKIHNLLARRNHNQKLPEFTKCDMMWFNSSMDVTSIKSEALCCPDVCRRAHGIERNYSFLICHMQQISNGKMHFLHQSDVSMCVAPILFGVEKILFTPRILHGVETVMHWVYWRTL